MEDFKEDEKGKRRASVLSSFSFPCFYVVCSCIDFFGEVVHFTERSGFLELCIIREKLMIYRVLSYDIGEKCIGITVVMGNVDWRCYLLV